jgi:hypothetical protein
VIAIPLRLYLYAAAAALLGYLLWREHYLTHKLSATRTELTTATATLNAERENTRKANAAAERFAISIENLKAARADTPVRIVRLCHAAASVPAVTTTFGTDATDAGRLPPAVGSDPKDRWSDDGPDVGPALYAEADRADTCHATLTALQEYERNR